MDIRLLTDTVLPVPSRPLPEAQIMELQARFQRLNSNEPRFEPGDIVYEKPGLGFLKFGPDTPLLVLRWLDASCLFDQELVRNMFRCTDAAANYDIVVMNISNDGAGVEVMAHNSAALTRTQPKMRKDTV